MTGPANMNYTSLESDIKSYLERTSDTDKIVAQIPRLVMMAENRIATDAKILGYQKVVTGVFTPANPVQVKPAYWRSTISFNYTHPNDGKTQILPRTYEYCRNFWPSPASTTDDVRFYSDYNFDNFFIVGTPASALPFELVYYARLDPLSEDSQVNWLTANAPQILLFACLYEATIWLKNNSDRPQRKNDYDEAMASFKLENGLRAVDRGIVVQA